MLCSVVNKFGWKDKDQCDDLMSAGKIGIMRAIDNFDLKKNHKFGAYCWFWIRKYVSIAKMDIVNPLSDSRWNNSKVVISGYDDFFNNILDPATISEDATIIKDESYDKVIETVSMSISKMSSRQSASIRYFYKADEEERNEILKVYSLAQLMSDKHKALNNLRVSISVLGKQVLKSNKGDR